MRQGVQDLRYLAELARGGRGTRRQLEELRQRRLALVLQSAATRVPYYRSKLKPSYVFRHPKDVSGILSEIPVSRKEDLRQRRATELLDELCNPRRRLTAYTTTGSTGVPFTVFKSPLEDLVAHFLRWRVVRGYGLRRGSTILRLPAGRRRPRYWGLAGLLGGYRNVDLNLTDPPKDIASEIRKEKPTVVIGNAGVLARVGRELREEGALEPVPDFVVASAEVLTPSMREMITRGFGCRVFDSYNCVEAMHPVAWECPETGLFHVGDDSVIVEVLQGGRPASEGEEGEVVLTSLLSRAMPVIRWSQGDLAVPGPATCPCGSPYSTLRRITGRMTDYLQLADGRELFASALAYVLHRSAGWILQYQIIQETRTLIRLRASTCRQPGDLELNSLRMELERLTGPGTVVRVELCRQLEPEAGGKFRVLWSRLRSPYD